MVNERVLFIIRYSNIRNARGSLITVMNVTQKSPHYDQFERGQKMLNTTRCSDPPPVPVKSSRIYSRPSSHQTVSASSGSAATTTGDNLASFTRRHLIYANRSVEGPTKTNNNRVDLLESITTTAQSNDRPQPQQQQQQQTKQLPQQSTGVYSNATVSTCRRSNVIEVSESSRSYSDRDLPTSLSTSQTSETTDATLQTHLYAVADQLRAPKSSLYAYDETQNNYNDVECEENERYSICRRRTIYCLSVLATVGLSIGVTALLFFFVAVPFYLDTKYSDDQLPGALLDKSPEITDRLNRAIDEKLRRHPVRQDNNSGHIVLPSTGRITCAAHVYLTFAETGDTNCSLPSHSSPSDGTFVIVSGWDKRGNNAFIGSNCVKIDPSRSTFEVGQTGLYTVYSHLAFVGPVLVESVYGQKVRVNSRDNPANPPLIADYQVFVAPPMTTRITSGSSMPIHSSMVTATVRLHAGDRLSVEATPDRCLSRTGRLNLSYFGFFKQND